MLAFFGHDAIRRSQEPYVGNGQAGLFGNFPGSTGLERFAVFEVAAGKGPRS